MRYRGYAISTLLLCLLFPWQDSFSANRKLVNADSIDHFFDQMELLRWSGNYQEAVDQLILVINQSSDDVIYKLRAENELAEIFRRNDKVERAFSILKKAEDTYGDSFSFDRSELVRLNLNIAKVFRTIGVLDSAVKYYEKAISLAESYGVQDQAVFGEIWMDWAFLNSIKGDIQTALMYNLRAQKIYRQSLPQWQIKHAMVLYELAGNYRNLGDFERGANCARMAEVIYNHHGSSFDHLVLNSRTAQANCYFQGGDYERANFIYEDVIERYTNEIQPRIGDFMRILNNNGESLLNLGYKKRAKTFPERSIRINRREDEIDSVDLAYSYVALSDVESQLGNYQKAEELLIASLKILQYYFSGKNMDVTHSYSSLGRNCERQNKLDQALEYYQKAMVSAIDDFNDMSIDANPDNFDSIPKSSVFPLLFDKARVLIKKYQLAGEANDQVKAFELYKIVYRLIREAANENMMEESLLDIPYNYQSDLDYGLLCALALHSKSKDKSYLNNLLQFIETNKYFLLQNSVRKSRAKDVLGIPDSAYQKERDLLVKINTLKQEINTATFQNEEDEYAMRFELFDVTMRWENLRLQWNSLLESTFSLHELSDEISIDSLRKNLIGDHKMLLEYFQTSDTLFTLAITKQQVEIFKLPKSQEFDDRVRIYLNHLLRYNHDDQLHDYHEFVNSAHFLYQSLLDPILSSSLMQGGIDKLTIIPDGLLSLIPFESLIQSLPKDKTHVSYFTLNYLCLNYTINYGYSLKILSENQLANNDTGDNKILAFSYSSSDQSKGKSSRDDKFGELPFSATELINIQKIVKNGLYLDGEDATEHNFKSQVQDHSIIHLALHGEADTVDILNSKIIFKAAGDSTEDGFLYAHELYGIDLSQTQMAVLSACETGIGKRMLGEGVYSLARGFAFAGCPAIVMSLWKVNDKTTAKIMDYFYQYIAEGLPKDEALRQAKLSYIENSEDLGAHPANWAAFITLGNTKPIQMPNSSNLWYQLMFIVVLIVLGLFVVIRFRKSRKSIT